jgi:hypothetical protein
LHEIGKFSRFCVVKPGILERKTIMVLAESRYEETQAAAEFLTDEHHLADLNRSLAQPNDTIPKYFNHCSKFMSIMASLLTSRL